MCRPSATPPPLYAGSETASVPAPSPRRFTRATTPPWTFKAHTTPERGEGTADVQALCNAAPFVRWIGDCVRPGTIPQAVYQGYHAALDI